MSGACSTYGGEERGIQDFGEETWRKETIWKTHAWMGIYVILRWIFRRGMWGYELTRSGSGLGEVAGTSECGNEPSGSIKFGES